MSKENNQNIVNSFTEVKGFQIAYRNDERIVYERFYENLKTYSPRKNETTNEYERCIIVFNIFESRNGLRELVVNVKKYFPSGTDYGNNIIIDYNKRPNHIPIDYDCYNEFFFSEKEGAILKGKRKIKINNLLNKLFSAHIRPTKNIIGLLLRTKLKLIRYLFNFIQVTIKVVEFIMRFACGKYLHKEDTIQELYLETMKKEQIKIVEGNSIKIAHGYECSKNVAFLSSLLIIIVAFIFWDKIKTNATVGILLIPTWIVILYFLDIILPLILLVFINCLIKFRELNIFGKIRI